jgi:hypothetical protein
MLSLTLKQLFDVIDKVNKNYSFFMPLMLSLMLKQLFSITATNKVNKDMLNCFLARIY